MDDFYSRLEQGKIVPMMFWKEEVSKYTWIEQTQLMIELIGIYHKEEINGRYGSDLHRYAKNLADFISQQSNIQCQMLREQQASSNTNTKILPDELSTPDAMKIWEKAKEAGWVNEDYSFNGTKYQMAYAAEIMGNALKLKFKWKPFQSLWKCNKLAQTRYESKERIGKVKGQKEIEEVFSL